VPPRLFLHEFLKPRGYQGIHARKKGFWVQVQHNCLCTQAFCANNSHSSFFHSLVARTSWSYLQCASTSSLSQTNAWLSSNFIGNIFIPPFTSTFNHAPLYWSWFCHFLQDIVPAPLGRTISYNIEGPISALGYQSPTLAQLMSRYATLDPTLISSASDKRKAPSLIAPSTVKKKRTSKKLLIQVRTLSFLNTMSFIILTIFIFAWFQTRTQKPLVITDPANASPTGKISPSCSLTILSSLALIPYLLVAEETLVSQTVGSSSP
jgi:hypothetical protein